MRLFALLADATRLRIVVLLLRGERNVGDLCGVLGLPQPTVSHHLGLLRLGAVLTGRRQGKLVYYALHDRVSADADGGFSIAAGDSRVRVGLPVPAPSTC